MQKSALLVFLVLLFFSYCTSVKKTPSDIYINAQQLNGRFFHKLFVEVETVDIQLRTRVEADIVEALLTKGYAGIKSLDLIPFSLKELRLPTEDEIKGKAKDSGCDGILLISLSRNAEKLEYTTGTVQKKNEQIGAGFLGAALNKGGAEIKPIPSINTPGSYSYTGASFVFKSQLFDLPDAALLFAAYSERIDASALEKNSKAYANRLIEQLKNEKLLK